MLLTLAPEEKSCIDSGGDGMVNNHNIVQGLDMEDREHMAVGWRRRYILFFYFDNFPEQDPGFCFQNIISRFYKKGTYSIVSWNLL